MTPQLRTSYAKGRDSRPDDGAWPAELANVPYWDLVAHRVQTCAPPAVLTELESIQDGTADGSGS